MIATCTHRITVQSYLEHYQSTLLLLILRLVSILLFVIMDDEFGDLRNPQTHRTHTILLTNSRLHLLESRRPSREEGALLSLLLPVLNDC